MPKIRLLHDVYKDTKKKQPKEIKIQDVSVKDRSKFYNSQLWKHTRNNYIQENPVCELCQLREIVKPAQEIHHAIKFHQQYNDQMRWKLLTDKDNLIALCTDHHKIIHTNHDLLDENQKAFIRQRKDNISFKYLQEGVIINYTNDINTKSFHT